MGLDTTHDCWHGPYSAFHRWRAKVAEVAGYGNLEHRVGFGGIGNQPAGAVPWPDDNDPLMVLLTHSDCDGEIAAADCGPLADALEALLPSMRRADAGTTAPWGYTYLTERFITGLRGAASVGEAVEFR